MRLHLKIIEEFHLRLSNRIPGSTISIGGEEKKKKIANELDQSTTIEMSAAQSFSLQATEDATKWNECLNPMLFAIVHYVLFGPSNREKLHLPLPSDEQLVFKKVMMMAVFLYAD